MKLTGGQILVKTLLANNIDNVFAIPGVQLDWAFDALSQNRDKVSLYVPRHEQTTTYMADGYYRVSGKPGAAMVVPGPGMLNAGAGIVTGASANSKILFLVGQIYSGAIGAGHGLLHEIKSQSEIMRALTKWSTCVDSIQNINTVVNQAIAHMNTPQTGPVGVEIPHDLLQDEIDIQQELKSASINEHLNLDTKTIEHIATTINQAKFPIIYSGGGVLASNASQALTAIAEKLGMPVVMSDNGLGALSARHYLGFSTVAGRALFNHADVVLVIGSRFVDSMYPVPAWRSTNKQYIYINTDARHFSAPRTSGINLLADAKIALEDLYDRLQSRKLLGVEQSAKVKQWANAQTNKIAPQIDYVKAMRNALPEDGIFVNELTQVGYLARSTFDVYTPGSYIGPTNQGTLGYGFATALGAAVGGAGKRVLSITGDGGFGWNLQELATARKYSLPVTLIIFNDGYFGNVRAIQHNLFGPQHEIAVDLQNPDFGLLAAAFDIPYVRCDSPAQLQGEITDSLTEPGPVVIEVPVPAQMPSPWEFFGLTPLPHISMPTNTGPDPLA